MSTHADASLAADAALAAVLAAVDLDAGLAAAEHAAELAAADDNVIITPADFAGMETITVALFIEVAALLPEAAQFDGWLADNDNVYLVAIRELLQPVIAKLTLRLEFEDGTRGIRFLFDPTNTTQQIRANVPVYDRRTVTREDWCCASIAHRGLAAVEAGICAGKPERSPIIQVLTDEFMDRFNCEDEQFDIVGLSTSSKAMINYIVRTSSCIAQTLWRVFSHDLDEQVERSITTADSRDVLTYVLAQLCRANCTFTPCDILEIAVAGQSSSEDFEARCLHICGHLQARESWHTERRSLVRTLAHMEYDDSFILQIANLLSEDAAGNSIGGPMSVDEYAVSTTFEAGASL